MFTNIYKGWFTYDNMKIKEKILDNGLKIIFEKNSGKNVYLAFLIKSGGIDEQENKKGISHFIEHMIYGGTKTRNREEIISELEKNGGKINGLTSDTSTVHIGTFNKKEIYKSLDIILDMLKNTMFSEEEIKKERKVILEEIKARKDNKLIYSVDNIQKMLFKKPFGENVVGNVQNVKSFKRGDLLKWYKKYYVPQNITLSIIGDLDINKLVDFLNKNFDSSKSKIKRKEPIKKIDKKDIYRKDIKSSILVMGYHLPKTDEKDFYASVVLNAILNEGMSSRLFKKIRSEKNLCYNIFGGLDANKYFSIGTIIVESKKSNMEKIETLILGEFKDICERLTIKELKDIQNLIIKKNQLENEDKKRRVLSILEKENAGIPQDDKIINKEISKVTVEQVKELSKKIVQNGYGRFRLISK